MIGGITLILTAAARIPAVLAEFLRACILVATTPRMPETLTSRVQRTSDISQTTSETDKRNRRRSPGRCFMGLLHPSHCLQQPVKHFWPCLRAPGWSVSQVTAYETP